MVVKFCTFLLVELVLMLYGFTARADIVQIDNKLLIPVALTKQDLVDRKKPNIQGFADGGQFEIAISRNVLNVTAPSCSHGIVLRMPWTDPDSAKGNVEIGEKKSLYDEFVQLQAGHIAAVDAVIDVAPYGHVNGHQPLAVTLTQCNAFFYTANGHVVRHLSDSATH